MMRVKLQAFVFGWNIAYYLCEVMEAKGECCKYLTDSLMDFSCVLAEWVSGGFASKRYLDQGHIQPRSYEHDLC